jgi:hypothetical protein
MAARDAHSTAGSDAHHVRFWHEADMPRTAGVPLPFPGPIESKLPYFTD